MPDSLQFFLNVIRREDLLHHAVHVQTLRVVARIGLLGLRLDFSLHKELVVVQIAVVCRHAEVVPHIFRAESLLARHQRFVQLLAVARADDIRAGIAEKPLDALGKVADRAGICFLDEQVAGIGVLKGELNQVHRLVQIHQEAGHVRVGDRDGTAGVDLIDKERDHGAAGAHDVAVAGAADDRVRALRGHAGVCINHTLHHGFGDSHRVDRIGCLVCRQAYHALDARVNRCVEDVVRALDVRLDGLHREKLAGRDLLERGCMAIASTLQLDNHFWMIELISICLFSSFIFKHKIKNHHKAAIFIIAPLIIIDLISFSMPITNHKCPTEKECKEKYITDNNVYEFMNKKYGIYCYLVIILIIFSIIMKDYSWIKAKYLMDIRGINVYKILLFIGVTGSILVMICLLIFSIFPCNDIKVNNVDFVYELYTDVNNMTFPMSNHICFVTDYDETQHSLNFIMIILYLFFMNFI